MGLFSLAHDSSTDVRKVVCTGLVQMLHLQPQKLQSHMTDIIEYMLQSNQVNLLSSRLYFKNYVQRHADLGDLNKYMANIHIQSLLLPYAVSSSYNVSADNMCQ